MKQKSLVGLIGLLILSISCVHVDEDVFYLPLSLRWFGESYFADQGLEATRLMIKSEGDIKLDSVLVGGDDDKGILTFFIGKGALVNWYYPFMAKIAQVTHYKVLGVNLRGYGDSNGKPSIAGMKADIEAVNRYLSENWQGSKKAVLGYSTGGFYALYLASLQSSIESIILVSPFSSAKDEVAEVIRKNAWWDWMLKITVDDKLDQMDNKALVSSLDRRYLFVHGDSDQLNPPTMSNQLFDLAPADKRKIFFVKGSGHNEIIMDPRFIDQISLELSDFIKR